MGQPGRAVSPSPRDRGADETRFGGHCTKNLVEIKTAPSRMPAPNELCAGKEKRCDILRLSCTRDEGGPLDVGGQAQASNHCKLLSSKAMVVSVAAKGGTRSRQV